MRSTHDRDGLNRTSDASHFLYGERPEFNVTLDVLGRGALYFVRTNRWHESPWHYEVDGVDHIVSETSTADPHKPLAQSAFEPAQLFPPPLALTWPTTKGSDLNWVPIPFEQSLRLAYGRTFYGTGYSIHHQFAEGAPLSSKPKPFTLQTVPGHIAAARSSRHRHSPRRYRATGGSLCNAARPPPSPFPAEGAGARSGP